MSIKEELVSPYLIKKPRGRVKGSKNKPLAPPFSLPGLEPRLTTREAAALLRKSTSTLEIYRCTGKGPRYWKAGGRVLYHLADLEAWEQSKRHTSDPTS